MRYFLIYLYKSVVVDVCSYDDEESQLKNFNIDSNKPDYQQHVRYDSVQIFNQVT